MGGFVALSGPSDPVFAQQVALCHVNGTASISVVTMVIVVLILVLVVLVVVVLLLLLSFLCNDLSLLGCDCFCVGNEIGEMGRRVVVVVVSGP
jgi:hypothetical protein